MLRVGACCCLCLRVGVLLFGFWVGCVCYRFMICDDLRLWVFRNWFDCLVAWLVSGGGYFFRFWIGGIRWFLVLSGLALV